MCQGKGGLRSNPILPKKEGPCRKTPFGGPGATWPQSAEAPLFSPPSHVLLPSPHPCLFSFVVKGSAFVAVARSFPPSGSTERGAFIGAVSLAVHGACGVLHAEKGDSQAVLQKVLKLSKNTSRRA